MRANTPLHQVILAAVVGFGLLGFLAFGVDSCHNTSGTQEERNANIASGEANAHQTQAQASDALVSDLKAKLEGQKADLGRIASERDALLRKLAAKPKPNANPAGSGVAPTDPMGDDRPALIDHISELTVLIAKDAEVIETQNQVINSQSGVIQVLTASRDEWRQTAEFREKQALAQEAATRAWKKSVTSSRWQGRLEGFAVGVALGYVGGKH